jgi:hypothetical protein
MWFLLRCGNILTSGGQDPSGDPFLRESAESRRLNLVEGAVS